MDFITKGFASPGRSILSRVYRFVLADVLLLALAKYSIVQVHTFLYELHLASCDIFWFFQILNIYRKVSFEDIKRNSTELFTISRERFLRCSDQMENLQHNKMAILMKMDFSYIVYFCNVKYSSNPSRYFSNTRHK